MNKHRSQATMMMMPLPQASHLISIANQSDCLLEVFQGALGILQKTFNRATRKTQSNAIREAFLASEIIIREGLREDANMIISASHG